MYQATDTKQPSFLSQASVVISVVNQIKIHLPQKVYNLEDEIQKPGEQRLQRGVITVLTLFLVFLYAY